MFKIFKQDFKGFTLIELLVVIAIIGILATVVIGAVNSARTKGADAGIRGNIANMRPSAEIFYDTNNTYQGICATGNAAYDGVLAGAKVFGNSSSTVSLSNVAAAATAAVTAVTTAGGANGACASNQFGWAALVPLKSNSAAAWCADSSGGNKQVAALTIAASGATAAPVCP